MKVLLINKFLYPRGGDALSTINTGRLLKEKGHKVFYWGMQHPDNPPYEYSRLFVDNIEYGSKMSLRGKISAALNILYSFEAKRKIEKILDEVRPDIVHLNNFAHQISPSILHVFKKRGIPSVMTMRDYKLVCPSYSMLAGGKPCEDCAGGSYYNCILRKCVKNSRLKSFINTAEMYLHHKILNIYDIVDIYISPSVFLKEKVAEMGFKKEVRCLPNFVDTNEFKEDFSFGRELCYFGRLSPEKGVGTLIESFRGLEANLKIIGSGPLEKELKDKVEKENITNVRFLGYRTGDDLKREIKDSIAAIIPSECYENNPRSVLESFAVGRPVIGARIGGIPELVQDGVTGCTFNTGDASDLREKILSLINSPDNVKSMGRRARKFIEEKFNPEKHYKKLMDIYTKATEKKKGK